MNYSKKKAKLLAFLSGATSVILFTWMMVDILMNNCATKGTIILFIAMACMGIVASILETKADKLETETFPVELDK